MASACRSILRSSSQLRSAAARLAGPTKSARPHLPKPAPRLLRCPVEMSCCVESLMPMHSATASALMTSLLSVMTPGFSSQGHDETR